MGIKSHRHSTDSGALAAQLVAVLVATSLAVPAWAAEVPVITVQPRAIGGSLAVEAHLEPVQQATVSAQLAGSVLALSVKAGDRVRAGQTLARIDDRDAQTGVLRGDAGLAQAEAEARNARMAAERTRALRDQGFVSQAALDSVETQLQAAQAGVQQARASRSQATLARGFAAVTAPFAGVVLATHLEAGDLAAPGRPVATVYAPGKLRATAQVPLSLLARARSATRVEVELPGGQRVVPTSHTELGTADPVSQTVEWRFDLPSSALPGLVPGQVARVQFSGTAAASASDAGRLRLPASAVLRRGELTGVYVVQDQRFALRAVRLGAEDAGAVEVLAGLRPGERVAANALAAGLADARPAP
jgi:RND family efflux transporter MFP subunit